MAKLTIPKPRANAAPVITPSTNRGNFTVKGTPNANIPKNPQAGLTVTGNAGVQWVYRPQGPNGPGWYKRGKGDGPAATPPGYMGQAGSSPYPGAPSGSPNAVSSTPAPAPAPAPAAAPSPSSAPIVSPATGSTFVPNASWWNQQFQNDPRWAMQAPGLASRILSTGTQYGYYINMTDSGAPKWKSRSSNVGDIVQVVDDKGIPVLDEKGMMQYRGPDGKIYPASDLVLDVRRYEKGEAGYSEGAIGQAEAASERRQFGIGDAAAQAGVGRSGMRASLADQETAARQAAVRSLVNSAGREFSGIQSDYGTLFNTIYSDLVKNAANIEVPGAEAPAPETPAGGAPDPSVPAGNAPWPGGGSTNPAGQYTPPLPTPENPRPTLSTGPNGSFMMTVNEIVGPQSQRGPQPMTNPQRIAALRNLKTAYSLTPQQIRWIDDKIADLSRSAAGGGGGGGGGGGNAGGGGGGGSAPPPASTPKPSRDGRAMYERVGPWQWLGRSRGWVKVG